MNKVVLLFVILFGTMGAAVADMMLMHMGGTGTPSGGGGAGSAAPVCLPMSVCPGGLM